MSWCVLQLKRIEQLAWLAAVVSVGLALVTAGPARSGLALSFVMAMGAIAAARTLAMRFFDPGSLDQT